MSTQEDPEPNPPATEEDGKSQRSSKGQANAGWWRKVAFFFGATTIVFLACLATALGIFLTKNECAPPPRRDNSTTTYLGSASPGTQVTYVCEEPLLFPDNSPTFTINCTDDLRWEPRDVPSCGIYTSRVCRVPDVGLTLTGRPSTDDLKIEITLQGTLPPSLKVDIPTYDDSVCTYDELVQESTKTASPTRAADGAVTVVVAFQSVDPWAPYEVRLRGIGTKLAVTVLQGDTTAITLTSLAANTTTPATTDTTDTSSSTHHTAATGTQNTKDITGTADTTVSSTT